MRSSENRFELARSTRILGVLAVASLVAACGGDQGSSSSSTGATTSSSSAPASSGSGSTRSSQAASTSNTAAATYSTKAFDQSFEVAQPTWLAPTGKPNVDHQHFLTWESPDGNRALRFMVPVTVYEPGKSTASAVPADYLAYLLGQESAGVKFTDKASVTVNGKDTTIFTATSDSSLDGSIGCPEAQMSAGDCFGFQPDLILRMAVIDADQPMVAWMRSARYSKPDDVRNDQASFADMLTTIRFVDRAPTDTATSGAVKTPIDGSWQASWTQADLSKSPLLMSPSEINDENWGTYTLTFDSGNAEAAMSNPRAKTAENFSYTVDGDVVTFQRDNGERFVMRWAINGDQLLLKRDDSLGVGPTPYVIRPFTRQP